MARRRWTQAFADELGRTTFAGQIDIDGEVARHTTVAPSPPPPPVDPPPADYVYAAGEQPELFE
jgi:hypothetical protein